ncbi:Glycosyl transferase family 2 [Pedobacter westerhofensis]|uniref:Glycosyl transferase family 2 n=1 Tax=Pedobacter westerhofensis TaxID=425512 RepID=A0A521C9C3_9SPHI|nr:glycosyltransferase [Pedobacter westerhofensis]SMO55974.1 Glycosyl transferase family 2 [Pedobacter westerhofensis]
MQLETEVMILMATYNGEAYLALQLDSIIAQNYQNWKLVIRDDGSTDGTPHIIDAYAKNDARISRITSGNIHGSAISNFSQLVSWASAHPADYYMFSDQDDIWKADKIAVSLHEIQAQEKIYGKLIPQLCYSNFQFIDWQGHPLPQKLYLPPQLQLGVLLNENHAWGCTMIINAAALQVVDPIPLSAVNHDYWIALVVAALGRTKKINHDLILYRQHTQNVSGSVNNMTFASRFKRYVSNRSAMLGALVANLTTIKLFYSRYQKQLNARDSTMIASFIKAYESGYVQLVLTLFKYRIFKLGIGKNAVYLYTLFLLQNKVISQIKQNSQHESTL